MVISLMLWVSLVWPFTFYSDPAHHTVINVLTRGGGGKMMVEEQFLNCTKIFSKGRDRNIVNSDSFGEKFRF
jgi:hypothetical protein